MNITKNDIFDGCLLASIVHSVMTNLYPDFSYEQSWDGTNYSINNSCGIRGTITFENDFCVGGIRNENAKMIFCRNRIQECMHNFPLDVVQKAYDEALQYLLLDIDGVATPCVTSVFWADRTMFHYVDKFVDNVKKDFTLFENIILPKKVAIKRWQEYYEINSNVIRLIDSLYQLKAKDFHSPIKLNERQKELIPGAYINNECIESLKELNIFI